MNREEAIDKVINTAIKKEGTTHDLANALLILEPKTFEDGRGGSNFATIPFEEDEQGGEGIAIVVEAP